MDRITVRPWATTGEKNKNERRKKLPLLIGIKSGARVCPALSPLLFLFTGEPLTRMIENDERLRGVTIGMRTRLDSSPTTPQQCKKDTKLPTPQRNN